MKKERRFSLGVRQPSVDEETSRQLQDALPLGTNTARLRPRASNNPISPATRRWIEPKGLKNTGMRSRSTRAKPDWILQKQ